MLPRIVPVEDEDVSKELERAFKKQGIASRPARRSENVQKTGNRRRSCKCSSRTASRNSSKPRSCWWRWAASRTPTTSGLENTEVELDRGFIKVDAIQQTAEPGVYAIGDIVAGTPQLAHVATREGMVAVAHIAGKPARPINKNRIPGATYTEPGIGSVGLTETQARAQGYQVKVGKFPFWATARRPFWAATTASSRWWPTRSTARFWASTSSDRRPTS